LFITQGVVYTGSSSRGGLPSNTTAQAWFRAANRSILSAIASKSCLNEGVAQNRFGQMEGQSLQQMRTYKEPVSVPWRRSSAERTSLSAAASARSWPSINKSREKRFSLFSFFWWMKSGRSDTVVARESSRELDGLLKSTFADDRFDKDKCTPTLN
jgi:hypothetical protein